MSAFRLEPLKLLVIGKTGVGKSAFCNFLFRSEIFQSNVGEAVTKGINSQKFCIKDVRVEIYDTEGFEVSNFNSIQTEIDNLIIKNSSSKITKNIQGVFYLLNASSARIEDFELNLIRKLSNSYALPVFVILTHVDVATSEQIKNITEIIKKNEMINIISLCTVQKTLRGGRKSLSDENLIKYHDELSKLFLNTSGRYYLYHNIFIAFENIKYEMQNLKQKISKEIEKNNFSILNITEWGEKFEDIGKMFDKNLELMSSRVEDIISQHEQISSAIDPHITSNVYSDIVDELSDFDFDEDVIMNKIESLKNIKDNSEILENNEGVFEKIWAGLSLAKMAVMSESTIKNILEEGFSLLELAIDDKINYVENKFKQESWICEK